MDDRRGVNPALIHRSLMEEFHHPQIRILRIFNPKRGPSHRGELIVHNDGRGPGGLGRRRVFGIGHKSDLAGRSRLDARDAGDLRVGIGRLQAGTQLSGNFTEFHGDDCTSSARLAFSTQHSAFRLETFWNTSGKSFHRRGRRDRRDTQGNAEMFDFAIR